ncbi:MAG: hypothetical protein GXP58_11920 [Deltaproteobacteria bacterium]|nr:hypothetical protein [Deltaproteobacteria bacterium]
MKRFLTGFAVLFVSVLMASSAMATRGPSPHAFGTRETGLGGAFDAISDDAISPAAYNPAGLTQVKNKRFDMDMIFLRSYQNFTNRNKQSPERTERHSYIRWIPPESLPPAE